MGRGYFSSKILSGKVERIDQVDRAEEFQFDNVIILSGRCNGWELFSRKYSGDLISDAGSGKAETVVKYLIDNYTSLSHTRNATELVEATDTTYTVLKYDQPTPIFDILKFICETADTSGTIGYDMRVDYDGLFAFFARGSKTETWEFDEQLQIESYSQSIERIKNKITIKGRDDKPFPLDSDGQAYSDAWSDLATPSNKSEFALDAASGQKVIRVPAGDGAQFAGDDWVFLIDTSGYELIQVDSISIGTEPGGEDEITMKTNLANAYTTANNAILWEVYATTGGFGFNPYHATNFNVVADTTDKHTGTRSIEMAATANQATYMLMHVFRTGDEVDLDTYPKIRFKIYPDTTAPISLQIKLWSGALHVANDIATSQVVRNLTADEWNEIEIDAGTENDDMWSIGSSFDWTDVQIIAIIVNYSAAGTYTFFVDRYYLTGCRWGGGTSNAASDGFAEDTTSQTDYGVREYFDVNDNFLSDAECEARAQALLVLHKDPLITIRVYSETVDWTSYHPMAANKVHVDLDPISVVDSFRIDEMDIHVNTRNKILTVDAKLTNKPTRLADYLYRLQNKIQEVSKTRGSVKRRR